VPLVLMNSFATHDETLAALRGIDVPSTVKISHFVQRRFPRLNPSTLRPVPTSPLSPAETWYPPGHGDVFEMIVRSGVAEQLIAQGQTYAFVSNIDNPGADLDPVIAKEMMRSGARLILEYTARTPNDRSGGVLVRRDNLPACLELSQVPDSVLPRFGSLEYSSFNTNNMWMHLPTIVELVRNRTLRLRPSVVMREMANGSEVLQLENAISSVQDSFPSPILSLAVPRKRWRVIKTTADLLMVRAPDLLKLHKGRLVLGEERRIPGLPSIKWGSHFRNVKDMEQRIPSPPDIVELVHLSVEGDVRFGKGIKLAGTVILIAAEGQQLFIPDGAILRDNIVIGSLTMTPH
jgi:UTP--glucose-1-phosphate uridylyltransferase